MVNGFKSLYCVESLTIPLLTYALIKLAIPIPTNSNHVIQVSIFLLRITLTIIGVSLLTLFILLCACYFELVKLLAKIKFRDAYYDVFVGADATWTSNSRECKSIIQVMYLFENSPNTPEKMKHLFTDPEFQATILKNHPRLSCVQKYFLGYSFYVKIKVNYTKVVRYFEDYNTLQEFNMLINKTTTRGLPYNGEFMWEVLIGKKPIQLEIGKWQIPLVTRYHHSITDGIALSMFMMTTYSKNGMERYKSECDRYNKCFSIDKSKPREGFNLTKFINKCKSILHKDIFYHYDMLRYKEQSNILHRQLSGEKVVCFSLESKDDHLLEKIKKTKRALNVSFGDVILSAISAAFTEYYNKFDKCPPKQILSSNPYFLKTAELETLVTVNLNGDPVTQLGNKFTLGFIQLPTDIKLLANPIQIIDELHAHTQNLKNSMDFSLMYWLFNIFATVVPKPFALLVSEFFDCTTIITNVPGVMSLSYRNDCKVENMFVWTNNFNRTGVTITLFTYDNMMRVTAHVDKNLIENINDIQKLSDNILRYIKILHDKAINRKIIE